MINRNRRYPTLRFAAAILALAFVVSSPMSVAQEVEAVDFPREIRPILADHCFQCHGPDGGARQAELRLDVREVAVAERAAGKFAIVPGEPDASHLLLRVTADDPDVVMPPPDQDNPLEPDQVELLRRWISEGAPYSDHWAFTAPERPAVPDVPRSTSVIRNPIDAFVADRLAQEGLAMSPPAAHEVLCRRIHLDLIGLPPAPNDVDAFVAAAREDLAAAVEAVVGRLLESEHFGEKWARHWLDVARYADSNGYEKDLRREQWAWRDWVIQSVNADMPYDQFLIEQIAGDLLPGRTQDQLVATGFLRNGMVNEEGAIIFEQFRMEGMFDRMDCIGKAVLGLSIQCAQCHSHKFDPISQDEYYGMFAFLNDTCEAQSLVYTPAQLEKIAEIEAGIREKEGQCRTALGSHSDGSGDPSYEEQLAAWEQAELSAAPKWDILDTVEQVWVDGTNHPQELPDHSVMVLGHPSVTGELSVGAEPNLDGVTGLRLEALTHGDLPYGGPGRNSYRGTFAITELRFEVMPKGSKEWLKLPLQNATADFSEPEKPLEGEEGKKEEERRRVGPIAFLIDGSDQTGWRADRGPGRRNTDSVAVVQFAEPVSFPEGTQLRVSLKFNHSSPGDGRQNTQLGRMRFALTKSPNPSAPAYDHAAMLAMQIPAADRSAAQQANLLAAWWRSVPELEKLCEEMSALWSQYPEQLTSVLSLSQRELFDRRKTFLLDRGIWDRPKHEVASHVPAILHPLEVGRATRPTRLDFARWLADRRSPLTARVQVNRIWQAIYGSGLVDTPEDFGTRATQPEHLKLLDWLAVEFMEHGWSTKHLLHAIISSATYQQCSRVTAQRLDRDPLNRLLARGPRFRAEAEVVRDITLCVSGLLNHKVGGPSIFPPVPQSVLDGNFSKPDYWIAAEGPERYRRAIYVFRKRSMPDPALASFDAPNADFACARRTRSNTPLASLVSLNEPVFVEAARAMALRILYEGGTTDRQRADYAFRLCTGRIAKPAEQDEVLSLLEDHRVRLAEGFLSINEVATGDPATSPALAPNSTPQDAAAWTIAARVLLNLDETLSKN